MHKFPRFLLYYLYYLYSSKQLHEEKNQMPRHLFLLYFNPLELPNY